MVDPKKKGAFRKKINRISISFKSIIFFLNFFYLQSAVIDVGFIFYSDHLANYEIIKILKKYSLKNETIYSNLDAEEWEPNHPYGYDKFDRTARKSVQIKFFHEIYFISGEFISIKDDDKISAGENSSFLNLKSNNKIIKYSLGKSLINKISSMNIKIGQFVHINLVSGVVIIKKMEKAKAFEYLEKEPNESMLDSSFENHMVFENLVSLYELDLIYKNSSISISPFNINPRGGCQNSSNQVNRLVKAWLKMKRIYVKRGVIIIRNIQKLPIRIQMVIKGNIGTCLFPNILGEISFNKMEERPLVSNSSHFFESLGNFFIYSLLRSEKHIRMDNGLLKWFETNSFFNGDNSELIEKICIEISKFYSDSLLSILKNIKIKSSYLEFKECLKLSYFMFLDFERVIVDAKTFRILSTVKL
mmetsp:Transcript_16328/g.25356  ORF Transcript_16328/g.25356 Transcript_16328/m.25356 type:complete len:417 (+) Transcript_16328:3005-4255(+)